MKVSDLVLRIKDRDIIKVELDKERIQPFYKSTGRNSSMAGRWLPFDGILAIMETPVWFDKGKYRSDGELHRFGTQELKDVSDSLSKISIPKGLETSVYVINKWLGYNI